MNKYKIVDNPEDTDTPWVLPEEIKEQYKDLYDRVIKENHLLRNDWTNCGNGIPMYQ